ncbi:helix-turn-helix domain-containing protein [Streptomyces sp. NBC_01465]|uniref:helix-turn-helix domain-containing protein n=1 Tax=Streptomyces sp. NBC_01465 TaxID=2903878 RepID=UPI002E33EEA1|nr:helix-turn-helix domain-containing protein [Streptomyces sp. NBC_01465]
MELDARVTELERRLAVLEATEAAEAPPSVGDGDFWALEAFKEQLAGVRAERGGVLFTGSVRLPTDECYEWQYAELTEELLADGGGEGGGSATADSLAALGHPVRLRLLREILRGRRTAAELADLDGIGTTGQIYHHLRQLTGAGWLSTTERGRHEVPGHRVVPLLVVLSAAKS